MPKYIIDITRFMSRIGRGKPTGIDRVEIAYIKAVLERDNGSLAVAKMGKSYVILQTKDAAHALNVIESGGNLGRDGLRDAFRLKLPKEQRRARQYFRSVALKQTRNVTTLFAGADLTDVEYLNVGHSNLTDNFLKQVRGAGCSKISIMIHDMIPLDFPEYTREGIPEQFSKKMKSALRYADRILCNSADTETRVQHYAEQWKLSVNTVVSHLGVEPMTPVSKASQSAPYFVCLGTIEPRKNHALLFEVWKKLAEVLPTEHVPALRIIGRRGWNNKNVFALLDTSPLMGTHIFEHADLDDEDLAKMIGHSAGLLFPSHAEGYGLPALEAAQIGVPVICSDLAVFHELLEGHATFVSTEDASAWIDAVQTVAQMTKIDADQRQIGRKSLLVPRWESHFCHVFADNKAEQVFDE